MSVCCECCVLTGRGLCDELITRPEESCRLWCVIRDLETSGMRRPLPHWGAVAPKTNKQNPSMRVRNPGQKFVRLIKWRSCNNCRNIATTLRLKIKSLRKKHRCQITLCDVAQSLMPTGR